MAKAPRKKTAKAPATVEVQDDQKAIQSSENYSRIVKHLHKRTDQPPVENPVPATATAIIVTPVALAPSAPASPAEPARPSHEAVAKLAYSYWVARGYAPGDPAADWLRAEQELLRRGRS